MTFEFFAGGDSLPLLVDFSLVVMLLYGGPAAALAAQPPPFAHSFRR